MLVDARIDRDYAIDFDPATHIYRVKGKVKRNVTRILEDAGISDFSMVPADVLAWAQERGTAVHRAIHYDILGDLDESSLDPRIAGYFAAYRAFMKSSRFNFNLVEHIVFSLLHDYIGMLDLRGFYPGRGKTILDWKTGEETDAWGPQLAAYAMACEGPFKCYEYHRLVVQLKANKTFKLHWYPPHTFAHHWDTFLWALGQSKEKTAAAIFDEIN
jgi:hypothetical protein